MMLSALLRPRSARTRPRPSRRLSWSRRGAVWLGLAAIALGPQARAQGEEPVEPVVVVGTVGGGDLLLNPVWNEAKDPKQHRYTFRVPSTTVSTKAKLLTAYLPKEVCIAALSDAGATPKKAPFTMTVSGGRTTPVTLVVPKGQEVQIENHDPFLHRIFQVGDKPSLTASDIEPTKSRLWTPAAAGKYELRDLLAPSLRSWVVVEPKAAAVAFPDIKNEFHLELPPGGYTLRAFFNGEPVGKPLPINVNPLPKQQRLPSPLILAEKKGKGPETKGD